MMQILQDDHLESLQCTKCRKYLSVFPVKNHPTRAVTCGRCSSYDDDEGVRSFLYELIAEKHLFKCINRFEGCRKLLRVEETESHEKVCVGRLYECPKCKDGTERHALDLIWHYKLRHPSSYLKKNSIQKKIPIEDVMLYLQDDILLFITIGRDIGSNGTYLNAATLTDINATQSFLVLGKGSLYEKTRKKACNAITSLYDEPFVSNLIEPVEVIFNFEVSKSVRLYDISVPGVSKSVESKEPTVETVPEATNAVQELAATVSSNETFLTVRLLPDFKNNSGYRLSDDGTALTSRNDDQISLICSNCKQLLKCPVYKCDKLKHLICKECSTWCGICDCRVFQSDSRSFDPLLEVIPYLQFPCKWKCGKYFTSDIWNHESICELRVIKCPECFSMIHVKFMKLHLLRDHITEFCEKFERNIRDIINRHENGLAYFLLNDKWCYLKWSSEQNRRYGRLYLLSFASLEENTKLGIIYGEKSSYEQNNEVTLGTIISCVPYLNFNCS